MLRTKVLPRRPQQVGRHPRTRTSYATLGWRSPSIPEALEVGMMERQFIGGDERV